METQASHRAPKSKFPCADLVLTRGRHPHLHRHGKVRVDTGKQVFIDRNKFAARLPDAGEAELRNVRILTPDKSEMMRYTFY